MKILLIVLVLLFSSCASKNPVVSGDSQKNLEGKYNDLIGKATKEDLVQEFGNAQWCHQKETGGEECRFYHKLGTAWSGEKTDRRHYDTYDEMLSHFDRDGKLESFKAKSQR